MPSNRANVDMAVLSADFVIGSVARAKQPKTVVEFGTPLVQDQQTAGIDLPVKALAWEDANGKVWLTYNDPAWLAQRHGLGPHSAAAIKAMTVGVDEVARSAAVG